MTGLVYTGEEKTETAKTRREVGTYLIIAHRRRSDGTTAKHRRRVGWIRQNVTNFAQAREKRNTLCVFFWAIDGLAVERRGLALALLEPETPAIIGFRAFPGPPGPPIRPVGTNSRRVVKDRFRPGACPIPASPPSDRPRPWTPIRPGSPPTSPFPARNGLSGPIPQPSVLDSQTPGTQGDRSRVEL